MNTVLILGDKTRAFEPVLSDQSISFLPVDLERNLLCMAYSWINSYFSRDKIFIVCSQDVYAQVVESCKGINEENIIVEPQKINYSTSLFYATLVLNKISPDSLVFYLPVNMLFSRKSRMENWLYAVSEVAEKEWIIVPSILAGKNEKNYYNIDAGKHFDTIKNSDFFFVNSINRVKDEIKRRKLFGKQGKILYIIISKVKSLLQAFSSDKKGRILKELQNCFQSNSLNWELITELYNNIKEDIRDYNFFESNKDFLTIFLNNEPSLFRSWDDYFTRFSLQNEKNIIHGNIQADSCEHLIGFNYDSELLSVEGLSNTVCYKKKGFTAIKKL